MMDVEPPGRSEKNSPAPNQYFSVGQLLKQKEYNNHSVGGNNQQRVFDGSNSKIPCKAVFGTTKRDFTAIIVGSQRHIPAPNAYNTGTAFHVTKPKTKFFANFRD